MSGPGAGAGPGQEPAQRLATDLRTDVPSDLTAALAGELVTRLAAHGATLAVAESLTGGALTAAVVGVPGASAVLRGGVVAYATDLKAALLGVDPALLDVHGAVHPDVAAAMAAGAARRLGSTWAVATTGVAGPAPQDGRPVGTVHLAVAGPVPAARDLRLGGGRESVRAGAARAALELLLACLDRLDGPGVDG